MRVQCEPFNDQCSHNIETSQMIFSANQLTGFYMVGTLVVKGLSLYYIINLKIKLTLTSEV